MFEFLFFLSINKLAGCKVIMFTMPLNKAQAQTLINILFKMYKLLNVLFKDGITWSQALRMDVYYDLKFIQPSTIEKVYML